jgi:DNA-binding transcriptional regulator GbsR (MarR family)
MTLTSHTHSTPLARTVQRLVFLAITQPLTATQISRKLGISVGQCCKAMAGLRLHKLVRCLTPSRSRSRLFWLTHRGKRRQRELLAKERVAYSLPDIAWQVYASLCFSHRSEVVRTLTRPMQPSDIARRAAFRMPGLRMSANNVRDVIRYLKAGGIVQPVKPKKRRHPEYRLTEIGLQMRRLLLRAEVQP